MPKENKKINGKLLEKKLHSAIKDMLWEGVQLTSIEVPIGIVKTPDGRKAQVTLAINADENYWLKPAIQRISRKQGWRGIKPGG